MSLFESILPQSILRRLGFLLSRLNASARLSKTKNRFRQRFSVILFLPLLCAQTLPAQSVVKIQGLVLDAVSGQPLDGANVVLLGTALGVASDASGRFVFENLFVGAYTLRVSYLSYESLEIAVTVSPDLPVNLTLRLQPRALELPGVEIAAQRPDDPRQDVLVITQAEILRSQSPSLGEFLKTVGSLEVQKTGGAGAQETVSIRGSNANQVVVMLDGVRLNNELTGEVDLAQIPLNLIERVEIYKGSSASLFGNGAIGGVISLTTLKGNENHLHLSSQTGSFGYWRIEPSWSSSRGRFDFSLAAQAVRSRGDFSYAYVLDNLRETRQDRINADLSSSTLFIQAGYSRRAGSLRFKAHRFDSERGQPGSVYYPSPYARSQAQRSMATLSYAHEFRKMSANAQINAVQNQTISRNQMPARLDRPFGPSPQFAFENRLQTVNAQLEAEWKPSGQQHRVGVEIRRVVFEDDNLLTPSAHPIGEAGERTAAVFIASQFSRSFRSLTFACDPSVRFDYSQLENDSHRRTEQQWSPHLQAFASVGGEQRFYLRASVGRAFRTPTFADLFYQDFRVQGQADLLPEKSRSREWAVGWQVHALGRWRGEVKQFRNRVKDMIVWRLGSFEFFRPFNTDAELSGMEAQLNFATEASMISVDLFYTLLQPLNKNPNKTLYDKMLPYRARATWTMALNINRARWQSSLQFRHSGERFVNEANTKSLPPYSVVDWTFSQDFVVAHFKIALQCAINNLLNERFEIVRDMPLPGREFRIGLVVNR
jgi:outer membrane cobalamin receptor